MIFLIQISAKQIQITAIVILYMQNKIFYYKLQISQGDSNNIYMFFKRFNFLICQSVHSYSHLPQIFILAYKSFLWF